MDWLGWMAIDLNIKIDYQKISTKMTDFSLNAIDWSMKTQSQRVLQ
jgi:hypothetical protein